MEQKRVTITQEQREVFSRKGNELIIEGLTTGFQLEDHNPRKKRTRIIYGHDNPAHLRKVQREIGGWIHPRESFYKWDESWKLGANTTLHFNRTLAKAKEEYITSRNINRADRFIRRRTIQGKSIDPLKWSWEIPDVRIYNRERPKKHYKEAFRITKRIDHNSRMAMVVTKEETVEKIRDRLKHERVKKVKVQNYRPKRHSFWDFVDI